MQAFRAVARSSTVSVLAGSSQYVPMIPSAAIFAIIVVALHFAANYISR